MVRKSVQDWFAFYLPTRVVHGANCVRQTAVEFRYQGGTKALVVSDQGVKKAGLVNSVLEVLKQERIPFVLFDEVEEDPGGRTVERGAAIASKEKCDGIVVVGGGSPMCAARGIGIVVTNGGRIEDYVGLNKASNPPLSLVAIPTTAGSGSEVSQYIILKDERKHVKMVIGSPLYFPKVAILDPMLLRTLPFGPAASAGVDALSHAIEATLTTLATPITDGLALRAVDLLYHNLRAACCSEDLDAKEACLIGSTMANMACGNALLGLAHTMTIPVEGMFKISHGSDLGILLPRVMKFNLPASHARFAALARAMGEPGAGRSEEDLASCALLRVKGLLSDLGLPQTYSDSQVNPGAIPEMARVVAGGVYDEYDPARQFTMDSPVPSVNIRKATLKEIIDLYEECFQA